MDYRGHRGSTWGEYQRDSRQGLAMCPRMNDSTAAPSLRCTVACEAMAGSLCQGRGLGSGSRGWSSVNQGF